MFSAKIVSANVRQRFKIQTHYISCKALQNTLKVTRSVLKERRKLFSSGIFVFDIRIYETVLIFLKRSGQGLFTYKNYGCAL